MIGGYIAGAIGILVMQILASRVRHESVGSVDVYVFPGVLRVFFY